MDSALQAIMMIGGPAVLGLVILWAIFHNKGSKAEIDRTEEATHELYKQIDREDKRRDNV